MAHPISEYLVRKRSQMTDFLDRLVRIESPSTVPESQQPILAMLSGELRELGYLPVILPGKQTGGHLFARPRDRKKFQPLQLLLGHCDTVWPLRTLSQMPVSIRENQMSGPGVYDMKAGLTQILFAIRAIREMKLPCPVTPVVLINSDEETGSAESGIHIRRLARIADRAFVLEPSLGPDGRLKTSRKGVGRFTITVTGRAAHAGLDPGEGASAIVELSHVIQSLFALNDFEKGITVNVGMIEGGTRANVVAPESRAVVDVRVPTMADGEQVFRAIYSLKPTVPGTEINVEGFLGRPPMEATLGNRRLWELAKQEGQKLGIHLEEASAGGGSDGNTTSQFTPTLDGLGAIGGGAHALHEFMYLDKMIERTALLVLLLTAQRLTQS